jgi:hypothetical protein
VDAADPSEDVSPSGVRAFGQSETAIAATNSYVVEAWNDATGFFSPCPSPKNKEEVTGFGFSADGGRTFTDMGGLPNAACGTSRMSGDPSVAAWQAGGKSYFYISSIFTPFSVPQNELSISACLATGTTPSARLACNQPTVAAQSSDCTSTLLGVVCGFLDKEFLTIDPKRGRLYVAYTEFGVSNAANSNGIIELAVCDIGTPAGRVGPQGGTAAKPKCFNGSLSATSTPAPYLTLSPGHPACEQEGVYPAVDLATGDVYAAWEFNWFTNFAKPACQGPTTPTTNVITRVPFSCLTLPAASCTAPSNLNRVSVISMDAAFVPGYNRFPANDFPRIAVSDPFGTVSIVWNDAGAHVLGDILMQTFELGDLSKSGGPVRLNKDLGGVHFLPAVSSDNIGKLNATWFQRDTPNTTLTNVKGVIGLNPLAATTPASTIEVTNLASDWNAVSSDIVPNFGDYTDNSVLAIGSPPYVGKRLFVAWSDGRIGEPQPFEANLNTHP